MPARSVQTLRSLLAYAPRPCVFFTGPWVLTRERYAVGKACDTSTLRGTGYRMVYRVADARAQANASLDAKGSIQRHDTAAPCNDEQ